MLFIHGMYYYFSVTIYDYKTITEVVRLVLSNGLVIGSPVLDARRLYFLEQTHSLTFPVWLQILYLAHTGFSALLLFLAALGIRNLLRLK